MSPTVRILTVSIVLYALPACGNDPFLMEAPPPGTTPAPALPTVLPRVLDTFAEPLKQMHEPMPSLTAEGTIELWVSRTGWEEYSQISAQHNGSGIVLPVGTTVLRAVRDPQGQIIKYTALVKREAGFDPPADLWWAVYNSIGELVRRPDGTEMRGKLPACVVCHLSRAEDGYVFGRTN